MVVTLFDEMQSRITSTINRQLLSVIVLSDNSSVVKL